MNNPPPIEDLIRLACSSIAQVIGIEPDFTTETLPIVDQYLKQLPPDVPSEVHDLVITSVGCYFGEVARRKFNGRWVMASDSPFTWRVELIHCFLYFFPAGMAGEVLAGTTSDNYDGSFATLNEFQENLESMLAQASPIPEDEYYSLTGRMDILELVTDWLVGQAMANGKKPPTYKEEDYRKIVEAEQVSRQN